MAPGDSNNLSERDKALALLNTTHVFPVHYEVSVITLTSDAAFDSLRITIETLMVDVLSDENWTRVPSRGGKYTSHRLRVPCANAEAVLELYARIRTIEGVVTVL
jgi:putative lipoic acid-binding regulatory protein